MTNSLLIKIRKLRLNPNRPYYIEITDRDGLKRQIDFKYNGDQHQTQKIADKYWTEKDKIWELKTRK